MSPSARHWLGTDTLGRDLLVRVLIGGRIALVAAFVATMVALVIGIAYGATAAYAGGCVATGVPGYQIHRDHRGPGTHPVARGRFFALSVTPRGVYGLAFAHEGDRHGSPVR